MIGGWSVRSAPGALVLVIVLGVAGTTMAALALRHADEDRADRAGAQQTMLVQQVVSAEIRRYSTTLADLAAAVGSQAELESAEFTAITAPIDQERLPGATGVSLVVPATDAEIPAVQSYWRARGISGLTLAPAATGPDHRFIVLNRPIDGSSPMYGRDVRASPAATDAMTAARDAHAVAVSRAFRLLRDAQLPLREQQLSFALAAPVYATSPDAPDNGRFRGWLVMGLRGGNFLHQVIGTVARDTVAVTLYDPSLGRTTPVATWQPNVAADHSHPARTATVTVPQRAWELTVQPTVRLLPASARDLDRIAWLIGLVITALLAALIRTVSTARDRALKRVDEATVALRDDIHRREEVEHQLRQRESELVGFAGVIAHDLRSPLARITGYADFLRDEAGPRLDPVHRDFLERLYGGAERMRSLIDDLLDYATADNRELTTARVDLRDLAEDVLAERVGDSVEPTVVLDRLPVVEGDPTLLRQVLDNLIGNALKYIRNGADPYVRVAGADQSPDQWRIDVVDHGIGIPEEQRETVFTAFTRADGSAGYPGTGLGLAIVQRIVERHGGTVGVTANPGGGSRFWFTLPKAVHQLSPSATATSASS